MGFPNGPVKYLPTFSVRIVPVDMVIRLVLRHGCHRSGNGQGKKFSRSGNCQGILFWVRENWHFEENSGKIVALF